MQQSLPESQPKPSGSSGTLIGGDKDHDDNNRVLGSSGRGGPGYHGGKPKGVRKSDGGRKGFTDDEQATIEVCCQHWLDVNLTNWEQPGNDT